MCPPAGGCRTTSRLGDRECHNATGCPHCSVPDQTDERTPGPYRHSSMLLHTTEYSHRVIELIATRQCATARGHIRHSSAVSRHKVVTPAPQVIHNTVRFIPHRGSISYLRSLAILLQSAVRKGQIMGSIGWILSPVMLAESPLMKHLRRLRVPRV
jgi:hypothetical protein